jgi:hypothetical protein
MVRLARRYGVSPVAQILRVNYIALKRHLAPAAVPTVSPSGTLATEFVEVSTGACPSGAPWVIELEDRGGLKLTVRLGQSDSASALALAQELWRHRS